MLKEIRDGIVEVLKSEDGLQLPHADIYHGEFANGSEWNPSFPAAFVAGGDFGPILGAGSDLELMRGYNFMIWIGNDYDTAVQAESIYEFFDGATLTLEDGRKFTTKAMRAQPVDWIGRVEVWRVLIRVY